MKKYLLVTCVVLASSFTLSAEAVPKNSVVNSKASSKSASFDNVVYLTKRQLFRLYPSLAQGNAGWPGDANNPGIPVYPVAKNKAQLLWQVNEYNRMLHMAQEDIQMSEQVDGIEQKNSDVFNQAASIGDVQDMKASTAQSREIFKATLKYGRDQETHLFKALGLHRALLENPQFRSQYTEGDRAVDYAHTVPLVQKVNAEELRFVSSEAGSSVSDPGTSAPLGISKDAQAFSALDLDALRYFLAIATIHNLTHRENMEADSMQMVKDLPAASLQATQDHLKLMDGTLQSLTADEHERLNQMKQAQAIARRMRASSLYTKYFFEMGTELNGEEGITSGKTGVNPDSVPHLGYVDLVPVQTLGEQESVREMQQLNEVYAGFITLANQAEVCRKYTERRLDRNQLTFAILSQKR